jgi:hypothetical protein
MQVYFGPNAGALMLYAQNSLPEIAAKDASHSDIEWLIDVFTAADRRGDAGIFAEVYKASALKRECDALLAQAETAVRAGYNASCGCVPSFAPLLLAIFQM